MPVARPGEVWIHKDTGARVTIEEVTRKRRGSRGLNVEDVRIRTGYGGLHWIYGFNLARRYRRDDEHRGHPEVPA